MLTKLINISKSSSIRCLIEDVETTTSQHVDMGTKRGGGGVLRGYMRRNGGYIFFVCVFLLFMRSGFLAGQTRDVGKTTTATEHPITRLMEDAETKYRTKLAGQSKTLKAAVGEYRRRYGRMPPKGFDGWWMFAREQGVKIVDEYDGLVEDLEGFWEMSGAEVRRRVEEVSRLPSIDLVRVQDGEASTLRLNTFDDGEVSARANGFRAMISRFARVLPDVDFPINAKAEGRVLVPWEHRKHPALNAKLKFQPDWGTDGTVWESYRRTCPPSSPARRVLSSLRNVFAPSTADFDFATTTSAHTLDFCLSPHEHYSQGHFFSDWRTLPALYPVFSPARARGFMDIRIPSHYYYGSTPRYTYGWDPVNLALDPVDRMEVPWSQKSDKVFWRGATTGGGSHPPGFAPQYQRHRFLRMTSDNTSLVQRTLTFPSHDDEGYATLTLPQSTLNTHIMDVAFTKSVSGDSYPGGEPALRATHRFADSVPLGRHWAYKYLVDLDGMAYSGRFLAFLASDSVPLKATVYEEFFEGWIQPWLHYIPLSHTYNEIYNIHAYFSGPPGGTPSFNSSHHQGDNRLRRIARAGKEWKNTVGRTVDMEVYVYRLALEWARICADDRDQMAFRL